MSASEPPAPPSRPPALALVAPGISALAVIGLLCVARIYDSLPFHPPPCGLRLLTGIPCLGCGGTRSMKALACGDVMGALTFNPLVALSAMGVLVWFAVVYWRHRRGKNRPSRNFRVPMRLLVAGVILLVAANWLYLIRYLPP